MSGNITKLLIMVLFFIPVYDGSYAQARTDWKYSDRNSFREIQAEQKTSILGVSGLTNLKFICSRDSMDRKAKGAISMELTVSPASKIKGFDFDYFEGPDAPAGRQRLLQVTVFKKDSQSSFQLPLTGSWSSGTEDGFTFSASSPAKDKKGDMRKIMDEILAGAEKIELRVFDGPKKTKFITSEFMLESSGEQFNALMKGIR